MSHNRLWCGKKNDSIGFTHGIIILNCVREYFVFQNILWFGVKIKTQKGRQ